MLETKRCTNCYGAKKVAKLGGMMGDCNTCNGKGIIDNKPVVKSVSREHVNVDEIIKKTAKAVTVSDVKPKQAKKGVKKNGKPKA
jgi:hypothetical protein